MSCVCVCMCVHFNDSLPNFFLICLPSLSPAGPFSRFIAISFVLSHV